MNCLKRFLIIVCILVETDIELTYARNQSNKMTRKWCNMVMKFTDHSDVFVKVLFIMLLIVKWKIFMCGKCIHLTH